jgi:cold shock CspA family protein
VEASRRKTLERPGHGRDAYETAISLEPNSAPLRLWYASFLARYFDDLEAANEHLLIGKQLDPESEEIQLESAKISMYRADFDSAVRILNELSPRMNSCNEWLRRKYSDSWIALHQRRIDALAEQHDWRGAVAEFHGLRKYFESIPSGTVDQKMREKVGKTLPALRKCVTHIDDLQTKAQAYELMGWIKQTSGRDFEKEWAAKRARGILARSDMTHGTVQSIKDGFGFIERSDGDTIFFHESALLHWIDWARLRVGGRVSFCEATDERGRKLALDVAVLDD